MSDAPADTAAPDIAPAGSIAVIGMACRLPGAPDIASFWANLRDGVESITRFAAGELDRSIPAELRDRAEYVPARPVLADVDLFDAGFFGMYPRETALTDPQQRLFLECAQEALDDAGCDPARYPGVIGVIAGASMNTYFLHHVLADRATIEDFTGGFQVGNYPMLVGGGDFIATRTAYKLDLRGPAMSVQTACSTSLVAIAQACQSLLLFQADAMLAGGASISFPQERGYLHQAGGMVSADGHCRSFDAAADGTVFGSGVGVVLLKRLEDALADGDAIRAVIRGSAVTNDGAGKVGFTAPSIDGQVAAIAGAQAMAGVAAGSISYVECHGTGTPLGDPIEIAALSRVFGEAGVARGACAIGSVKSNIGHLDAAAGVAGFIKTVLALEHATLPASLHFQRPNPRLELEASPFRVNAAARPWTWDGPLRAGVSALGVGGTNVHLVLEQAPPSRPVSVPGAAGPHLLVISARTESALRTARARLATHLAQHQEQGLADVAFTLQVGRRQWPHRAGIVAADHDEAIRLLGTAAAGSAADGAPRGVAYLFPGQGSQYPGMARELYGSEPAFRDAFDACAAILPRQLGPDLHALLQAAPSGDGEGAGTLDRTELAQPAIFAVEYALAQLWLSWGIPPVAMLGHSVGEFAAACLAGVMTLPDALGLVAARGRLMQALPEGAMLSVRLPEAELAPLLEAGCSIAAINAPMLCVAAGPHHEIDALAAALDRRGVAARRLRTSHAFHSPMVDPAVPQLAALAAALTLRAPAIPFVSGVTGTWITGEQATDPLYWARHCRAPVRFADAVAALVEAGRPVLLEVGPGRALSTLARQGAARAQTVVASLPDEGDAHGPSAERRTLLQAVGKIWAAGIVPDWRALHASEPRRRVHLPTTPFERERHWIDAPAPAMSIPAPPPTASALSTPLAPPVPTIPADQPDMNQIVPATSPDAGPRVDRLCRRIAALLETLSGDAIGEAEYATSFVELGFDSLFLGQFAQALGREMGLAVAFRDLLGELPTVAALAAHADAVLPAEALPVPLPPAPPAATGAPASALTASALTASAVTASAVTGSGVEALMAAQLQAMQTLFSQQLAVLRGGAPIAAAAVCTIAPLPAAALPMAPPPSKAAATLPEAPEPRSRFAVYRPGAQAAATLSDAQHRHVETLIAEYVGRTKGSRDYTARHRSRLADPRVAAGFRTEWKDLVYPILCTRAAGAKLWDVDGNEYIDLVNGYGQTFLGHGSPTVVEAMIGQLREGFAIGPQSPLAGEVADLICELTGNDRATFCNTGSEAVMAAMRVARAVTGRDRVVMFGGAYHGQFDEVLVKGARSGTPRALPVAPGIPAGSVQNMVVLPYTPESLEWVRANAADCAAVIVEPVQSRHPDWQPRALLAELRAITEQAGAALVFDEVVTGFRIHPGGMQSVFGIRADLATYGKVLGGGMPIGVLAGSRRFMDALDGGLWDYGDESYPEVAPTFFAGTFVRHPVVLAAARAVLLLLKQQGPALQRAVADRTAGLVASLQALFAERGVAASLEHCGSLFYLGFPDGQRLGSLLWYHLRARGIYVQEGFPCFMTTEHGEADVARIVAAFAGSLDAMLADGVLERTIAPTMPFEITPTEPQAEIWLAAQFGDAASCAFNEGLRLELDGELDDAALHAALNDVVARHDALRSVLSPTGETVRVLPALAIAMPIEDADEASLATVLEQEATRAFDLAQGPLLRARLLRFAPRRHTLVLTAHHIVCDGWSFNVILDELAAAYAARRQGHAATLPAPLPFSRYAGHLGAAADAQDVAWWTQRFATLPEPLHLPADRPRPSRKSYRGDTHTETIDAALATALRKAGGRQGCTLFATLLTGLTIVLGRLADSEDVVVATPAAGQSLAGDQVLVGHCVNLLPLRARWSATTSTGALLRAVQQTVLDAYDHQSVTLGTIVRALDMPREPGRVPLADVQFNLERLSDGLGLPGLEVATAPNPKRFVNFDLFINVIESAAGLRLDIDYSTDLFDTATIARWVQLYRTVLRAIVADPEQEVRRIALAAPAATAASIAHLPPSVVEMVARAAGQFAEAAALSCEGTRLSYRQMQRRVETLAALLSGRAPRRVGVLLRRSVELPIALLAVLRAGLAYVPLDWAHPPARLRAILETSGAGLLLTDGEPGEACPDGVETLRLDMLAPADTAAAPMPPPGADQPAYVIYTSGSTGEPKGVEIPHGALVNLLASMAREPGFGPDDRLLAVTTVAFDIAGLELLLPLTVGGEVVIAGEAASRDGTALVRMIAERGITVLQATPSLWRILLEAGFAAPAGFRMLAGGEPLDRALADRLLAGGGALWNMYGPTETTIWSAVERVAPGGGPITIGHPIAGTGLQALDREGELRPDGVTGELVITGAGLARGYVGAGQLTEAAFPTLAFGGGTARAYRTGDLARRLPDGRLQLLGRRDRQVKLRGFRIELGEIESALCKVAGVAAGAVMLRSEIGGGQLAGYYVAADPAPTAADLTRWLAQTLPDYMVPALWLRLPSMPMSPNGKIDRAALPLPGAGQQPGTSRVAPRTAAEQRIAGIWQDVLGVAEVGVTDSLFTLGADSIDIFRIAARLARQGIGLSASDLLAHPTIAEQASLAGDRAVPSRPSLQDFVRARRAAQPA